MSTCSCHSFHVQALWWCHGLQVHCGVSRIHSFESTVRWVGGTFGSDTASQGDADGQRQQLLEGCLLLLLATTLFLERRHSHRLVPHTLSDSVRELRQKELRTFWEFEHLTFWPPPPKNELVLPNSHIPVGHLKIYICYDTEVLYWHKYLSLTYLFLKSLLGNVSRYF